MSDPLSHTRIAATVEPFGPDIRRTLARFAELGIPAAQLSATQPGLRPRDLDRPARRDLAATLRRLDLRPAGLDLWIPPEHYGSATHADRAIEAARAAIELARELDRIPISLQWPHEGDAATAFTASGRDQLLEAAADHRVRLIDHHPAAASSATTSDLDDVGLDPPLHLARGDDPVNAAEQAASRLAAVRLCTLNSNAVRGPLHGGSMDRFDLERLREFLRDIEFTGGLIIDARQWTDPWTGLTLTRNAWETTPG